MANRLRCKKCAASYKGEGGPSAAWLASYGRNGWPVMAGMGGQLRPECPASYGRNLHYQSPSKNGRVERFHLSLKSEAFRNVVPINLEQAQRVCTEYKKYYNHHRPHQGIAGKIPGNSNQKQTKCTKFILHKHLGGKITSFDPNLLSAA